jgi:anthranilate 1,2-dioxygenase small subunit
MMGLNDKISAQVLRAELRDLYEDYAAALDQGRLEDWTTFFTEGAVYKVMARESYDQGLTHATIYCDNLAMIRDRAASIRETAVFEPRLLRHFISGVQIDAASEDEIAARANFLVVESLYDAESQILMVGEYHDLLVRTPEGLKFKARLALYDNYRVRTTLIMPV